MKMQLCGANVSPFFERVFIALDMKGALDQLEYPGIPGGMKSEEHFGYHPMGKVPFLVKADGSSLTEGQIIAEYLDTVLDGPDLMPDDADAAARVKAIARIFDLYYYPAQRPLGSSLFGGEEGEEAIQNALQVEVPKVLQYVEKYLGDGERAVGDDWTLADAVLMVQLYWHNRVFKKFGAEPFGDCRRLAKYWDTIKETDMAKRSFVRIEDSFEKVFGANKA